MPKITEFIADLAKKERLENANPYGAFTHVRSADALPVTYQNPKELAKRAKRGEQSAIHYGETKKAIPSREFLFRDLTRKSNSPEEALAFIHSFFETLLDKYNYIEPTNSTILGSVFPAALLSNTTNTTDRLVSSALDNTAPHTKLTFIFNNRKVVRRLDKPIENTFNPNTPDLKAVSELLLDCALKLKH